MAAHLYSDLKSGFEAFLQHFVSILQHASLYLDATSGMSDSIVMFCPAL